MCVLCVYCVCCVRYMGTGFSWLLNAIPDTPTHTHRVMEDWGVSWVHTLPVGGKDTGWCCLTPVREREYPSYLCVFHRVLWQSSHLLLCSQTESSWHSPPEDLHWTCRSGYPHRETHSITPELRPTLKHVVCSCFSSASGTLLSLCTAVFLCLKCWSWR